MIDQEMPAWRQLARIWPGQFRGALASRLMHRSLALRTALRDGEAVTCAEEGVAIYRSLAAARPHLPKNGDRRTRRWRRDLGLAHTDDVFTEPFLP
jgi:hypothetical protein